MICFTQLEKHPLAFLAEGSHIITARLQELFIPKIEKGTVVVINSTTKNIDFPLTRGPIFLAGWFICMYLELFLPLNSRKTSASSTWTRTWDVFCFALVARLTNTSRVLVCGDDADVFILLFHHAHRLCDVIMELDVSGRNNWRCINVHELARNIGPQVSEMSLFAVLWFRTDQRLLTSTVVPFSIPGMSSIGYLPCELWLRLLSWWWLKRIIQMLLRVWMKWNCYKIMSIASWKLLMHVL